MKESCRFRRRNEVRRKKAALKFRTPKKGNWERGKVEDSGLWAEPTLGMAEL